MKNNGWIHDTDEERERSYRTLFPPDEAREFARPLRRQLPTERIAWWSVGLSLLFAVVLVVSWRYERRQSPKPAPKTSGLSASSADSLQRVDAVSR